VSARDVEGWLEQLMREKWEDLPTAAKAAVNLSRMTGDRARDISDHARSEVVRRLERLNAPSQWIHCVTEVVPVEASESLQQYGEELPVGLIWCPPEA
jgi:hypothetical protein